MLKVRLNLRKVVATAICLAGTTVFSGCDKDDKEPPQDPLTYDEGVVINGVKWATRNVAAPGTFAIKPEDAGMFYQWNRKTAWAITGNVTGWDTSKPEGDIWEKSNDPSPAGWHVPTLDEIEALLDAEKVTSGWIAINGINGRKFTDKTSGNSIFLFPAGCRMPIDGLFDGNGLWGNYWSSEQKGEHWACHLSFDDNVAELLTYNMRGYGFCVRSVAD